MSVSDNGERVERHLFRRAQRLTHAREYQAAFRDGIKKIRGPIVVFGLANGLSHPRLGLSVPGRVGIAVERNRIKRRVREAFRLRQHELPPGLDLVVSIRKHAALPVAAYADLLTAAASSIERERRRRAEPGLTRDGDTA